MEGWIAIPLFWIAFTVTHVGLSSRPLREPLVARLGEPGFRVLYSLVALLTFVPLVWVYVESRHTGPLLWSIPLGSVARWIFHAAMGVAFVLVVAGLTQPSPAASGAARVDAVRGVHRITRHGLFMGFGLFGLLHLIPNGHVSDVAFFAGFPIFVLIGCWHQDRRKRSDPALRAWYEATPFLPFTGQETFRGLREIPAWVIGLGIVVTIGLRWLHGPLFR